jgi:glycosyltransferase involved in cell wall biosynthesis
MSSAPMVSVVLPAHQAAAHLREAVDSIQAQTLGDLELIIIDDGSTDDTARIARGIRDPRVRYQRTGHRGVAAALNVALDLASNARSRSSRQTRISASWAPTSGW